MLHLLRKRLTHNRLLAFTIASLTLMLCSNFAFAYLLPPTYLGRLHWLYHKKYNLKDLTLDLEIALTNNNDDKGDRSIEGRIYLKQDRKMRWLLHFDEHAPLVMVEDMGARSLTADSPKANLLPQKGIIAYFFATKSNRSEYAAVHIAEGMRSIGIDVKTVSLKRHEDRIVYVAGAKPWETEKPQIWFDKETMHPVFIKYYAKSFAGKEHSWELWLRNYDSTITRNWFPAEIELLRDQKRIMTMHVQKADRNNNLPNTLFKSRSGD